MDSVSRHRLLSIFPSSSAVDASAAAAGVGDELTEDDVLWTNDFIEQSIVNSAAAVDKNNENITINHRRTSSFQRNSGILAALPDSNNRTVLSRKSSIPSPSKAIPVIPRFTQPQTEREYVSQSLPTMMTRKMNQSAPMNVPLRRNSRFMEVDDAIDDGEDEEKLPPHEIVARGSRNSPQTTFSVLEGVGRTLKGRDLRQVRNAVWRQTGFLD